MLTRLRPPPLLPGLAHLLAASLVIAAAASIAAASDQPVPNETHRLSWGVSLGYAHAFQNVRHPDDADTTDPRMLVMSGQVFYELADWRRSAPHGGSALDIVFEPQLMVNFAPTTGFGGAATGGFRWRFLRNAGFKPHLIGVAGIGGIDFDLSTQDDGFEFWLEAGVGVRRSIGDRQSLTFEARFHHISNAGTHPPNLGIDAVLLTLGVEF
jgi:hypothetical protein